MSRAGLVSQGFVPTTTYNAAAFGQTRNTNVCAHCNNLDLDALFARRDLVDLGIGTPLVNLKNFSRRCRDSPCAVCSFLARSTPLLNSDRPRTWHLRAYDYDRLRLRHEFDQKLSIVDISRIRSFSTTAKDLIRPENLVLALTPDSVHDHCCQDPEQDLSHCILPMTRSQTTASSLGYQARLVQDKLDYSFLNDVLDNCLEKHNRNCSPLTKPPSYFQVIDCNSKAIIDFPGGCYAALSYCIGPQSGRSGSTSRWPQVVMDAIECCKNLRIGYLWVDQLCIDQNDPAKLANAISQMHEIYSFATLTIVSLAARQADGLPGVGNIRRKPSPRLSTTNNTYVSTPVHLFDALRGSKWMTRGWCYQEAALSRRLLILGSDQAYFICNTSTVFESISCDIPHSAPPDGSRTGTQTNVHMLEICKGPFLPGSWMFGRRLSAYTARDLSYQSDALNAFRGMLNVSLDLTYWGVPFMYKSDHVPYTYSEAFAIGLSWATSYNSNCFDPTWKGLQTPTGASFYRRPEFPSWSWAGWRVFKNPICYTCPGGWSLENVIDIDRTINYSQIVVSFENGSGEAISAFDLMREQEGERSALPEMSRFVHIEAQTIQLRMYQLEADMPDGSSEFDNVDDGEGVHSGVGEDRGNNQGDGGDLNGDVIYRSIVEQQQRISDLLADYNSSTLNKDRGKQKEDSCRKDNVEIGQARSDDESDWEDCDDFYESDHEPNYGSDYDSESKLDFFKTIDDVPAHILNKVLAKNDMADTRSRPAELATPMVRLIRHGGNGTAGSSRRALFGMDGGSHSYDHDFGQHLGPYYEEEEVNHSKIARFCVNMENHPEFDPKLSYYALDPDHDQHMVDFDWPPTMSDKRHKKIHGKEYLGIILFFAPWKSHAQEQGVGPARDGGAYCVLLCELHESGQYYERVGRAWVPDGHLGYFASSRRTVRLG